MADQLLSALLRIVVQKSADLLKQRISDMWGIADQREKLHDKLLAVQAVLTDAEEQGDSNLAVKSWLAKMNTAAYDADDVLDEFIYEELRTDAVRRGHKVGNASGFFSLENPVLFRYKMSRKLKEVVATIDELVFEMQGFKFDQGRQGRVVDRDRTHSYVIEVEVIGREEDKENLVKLLTEVSPTKNPIVLPVVGMGGIGKTTLAQLVYNDPKVQEYFNLLLWVCVSEEFNIGHLVKSIIELVNGECNLTIDNVELLQRCLREILSGKRYFIVLDDVWNDNVNEWERLRALLDCGDLGSVVIVTTRNDRVATIMGTMESYNLGCLSENDSWSLFHRRAFSRGVKECQELVEIGRKIVQNCQGLPLAINTLGSLMSYEHDAREWLAVLKNNKIWEQNDVLPILRLSYDHLPSYMKQCFAFCAVYPKDYEMEKEKLIQYWMANGFIPSDGSNSLEMEGNHIFNELAWRSFFQDVRQDSPWEGEFGLPYKTKCKMHDLMHDLAQSIMGDKCKSILEVPTQPNQPMINVHHVSVRTPPIDINKAIDCFPSIRSLISTSYILARNYVKNIEFLRSNSLRLLQLNVEPIEKTIFAPEKMKHLRYLELSSREGGITSLPEAISTLYLLQTLNLSRCFDLEKLPEGLRYMSNLRHLLIERCHKLTSMPEGLGQLHCLQILTTYIVGTDDSNSIRELTNLNNLYGQLRLYNLRNIKHVLDAREANLIAKNNLDDLALCWGMREYRNCNIPESNAPEVMHCDSFDVLDALKPCNKLKALKVTMYRGDQFPVWMTEYQMLENLIELYLIDCRKCRNIPPVEKLPFLQTLELRYFDNLRHLCNSASTSGEGEGGEVARVAFPSLASMVLSKMPELCSWYEGEVGNKSSLIFPELQKLDIYNCPKLTAMPIVPSLTSISVGGNKNLSRFATELTTLQELSLIGHGGNESLSFQPWESLERLTLVDFNSIVPVGANEGEVSITPTNCVFLQFITVSNIPSSMSLWFWKCFTFLDQLRIHFCDNLIYWPENEFRSLNCLTYLMVSNCPNFLGSQRESPVGRSITEVLLPILQYLYIDHCPNLVQIPKCSASIETLNIHDCPKLQCLPEWLGSMIALKDLHIGHSENLNSLPRSMGGLSSLEELTIIGCPNLAYLPEGMEGLALETLSIIECPKIRVLPEGLLQQLKNLNKLWVVGCPHLERHFRKYGKYQHLICDIRLTKFGEERRFGILKDLSLSLPSCKITCSSARS